VSDITTSADFLLSFARLFIAPEGSHIKHTTHLHTLAIR